MPCHWWACWPQEVGRIHSQDSWPQRAKGILPRKWQKFKLGGKSARSCCSRWGWALFSRWWAILLFITFIYMLQFFCCCFLLVGVVVVVIFCLIKLSISTHKSHSYFCDSLSIPLWGQDLRKLMCGVQLPAMLNHDIGMQMFLSPNMGNWL